MPTLIRASNLWGFGALVHELGADPARMQARFGITLGAEHEEDAFIPFQPFVRMLEAAAEEFDCPDFGMRLSRWQGLDILGPIAVIARPGYESDARASPAMSWLRRSVRPAGQAKNWTRWRLPALVLLRFRPDPTSATSLRAADPAWHRRFLPPPKPQRTDLST